MAMNLKDLEIINQLEAEMNQLDNSEDESYAKNNIKAAIRGIEDSNYRFVCERLGIAIAYILNRRINTGEGKKVRKRTAQLTKANEALRSENTKRNQVEEKHGTEKLVKALEDMVEAMAMIVEMRDPYTAGHQRRVTQLSCAIAKKLGLSRDEATALRLAGLIHDIGKVHVPSEILTNPDGLSEAEFSMIKVHPLAGYEILSNIQFPWPIAQIVYQHHERMNGSGYPLGLSDGDILLEARILAVADVVEAMSSHRPYRPALGIDKALSEITQKKGVLYDADVVGACLWLFTEKSFEFEQSTKAMATRL